MAPGCGRDPLVCARFLQCGTCRQARFPVDATWIDDELILATYPRTCQHFGTVTMLIDVREVIVATADVDPARYLPGRRCAGLAASGHWCRAFAVPGSDFCAAHPIQPMRRKDA